VPPNSLQNNKKGKIDDGPLKTAIMNDRLKTLIEQYTELEHGVQELLREQCQTLCGQCTLCCCDAIICEEALESAFLKLLHKETGLFSEQYGFLSPTGCSLKQGRPPTCYEYFCDDQIYFQPDELHGEILQILGALPNHATRKALGDQPLAEIIKEEALDQLNFQTLEKQLQESFQALTIIQTFYQENVLPDPSYSALKNIHRTP